MTTDYPIRPPSEQVSSQQILDSFLPNVTEKRITTENLAKALGSVGVEIHVFR